MRAASETDLISEIGTDQISTPNAAPAATYSDPNRASEQRFGDQPAPDRNGSRHDEHLSLCRAEEARCVAALRVEPGQRREQALAVGPAQVQEEADEGVRDGVQSHVGAVAKEP